MLSTSYNVSPPFPSCWPLRPAVVVRTNSGDDSKETFNLNVPDLFLTHSFPSLCCQCSVLVFWQDWNPREKNIITLSKALYTHDYSLYGSKTSSEPWKVNSVSLDWESKSQLSQISHVTLRLPHNPVSIRFFILWKWRGGTSCSPRFFHIFTSANSSH